MILAELRQLLIGRLGLEPSTVQELDDHQLLFGGALGLDSVDLLELVVAVEQAFGVTVPNEVVGSAHFASLGALANYLTETLGERGQSSA